MVSPVFVRSVFLAGLAVLPFVAGRAAGAQRLRVPTETSVAVQPALLSSTTPNGATHVLATPLTIDVTNVTLEAALDAIAAAAGVQIMYSRDVVPLHRRVSVTGRDMSLKAALDQALAGSGMEARVSARGSIMIARAETAQQGRGTIMGKITSAKTKQPVEGASITLDGSRTGVTTGTDGLFRITASAGEHMVNARSVGFVMQTRRATVSNDQSVTLEFALEPSTSVLDEVVVTGTVVATERKAVPNPITVFTAKDIEQRGITRVEQLLRGEVPGVIALERGSEQYSAYDLGGMSRSRIFSRGSSGLTAEGNATPLKTYIDGVELLDPSYLGTIDPKSIERIEIITGPQAATVYGSGAMGGVMQIFTKKGRGGAPDVTLNLRYGMLESSYSPSRTPTHNDALNVTGGTGPEFSYAANASYTYSGQWMPKLFNRIYGGSLGFTHVRGPLTATASTSMTSGRNGTALVYYVLESRLAALGIEPPQAVFNARSGKQATSRSSTSSLSLDYRPFSFWQHHVTVGQSQTKFELVPHAPDFMYPYDTLYYLQNSDGKRTTFNYNTTLTPASVGVLSTTLSFGLTGSDGEQTSMTGYLPSKAATSYSSPTVTTSMDDRSWGGFGRWQLGVFNQLYFTAGLRGEHNRAYGEDHTIDWTPTAGVTYTIERGDLTLKLLGSYGRATRPPVASYRYEVAYDYWYYEPSHLISQRANPALTPEYSRGPQGGFELYYGNLLAITVNRYDQMVSDLIQNVQVDSMRILYVPGNYLDTWRTSQYQNAAKVRQYGWETTGALNLGALTFKGTYSLTNSRVVTLHPNYTGTDVSVGTSFQAVPSHTGNLTVGYAQGRTSVALVTNYMGQTLNRYSRGKYAVDLWEGCYVARLPMYGSKMGCASGNFPMRSYVKSDLTSSVRLSPWASLTVDIQNIGDTQASDNGPFYPALGRTSTFGMSLRWPTSR